MQMYGDNIYHTSPQTDVIVQEFSHHSYKDGSTNYKNYNTDVPGEKVLVAERFWYFGNQAIEIPPSLICLSNVKRGHRVWEEQDFYYAVRAWLES